MSDLLCNNIDGSFECLCPPGTVMMDDECLGKLLYVHVKVSSFTL